MPSIMYCVVPATSQPTCPGAGSGCVTCANGTTNDCTSCVSGSGVSNSPAPHYCQRNHSIFIYFLFLQNHCYKTIRTILNNNSNYCYVANEEQQQPKEIVSYARGHSCLYNCIYCTYIYITVFIVRIFI